MPLPWPCSRLDQIDDALFQLCGRQVKFPKELDRFVAMEGELPSS